MRKRFLFLLFLSFVVFSHFDVFAFTGSYNYEVKSLRRDESGNITVMGWAIPNAGVKDTGQKSPVLNVKKGSGSNSKCTGNASNYYQYTLYAVPLDKNQNYKNNVSNALEIGSVKGSGTDLTSIMCYTSGGSCVKSRSSCYENVGWSFTFSESLLNSDTFQNGYVLYLKLYASGDKSTVSFPLIAYEDRIVGFGSDYTYSDGSTVGVDMKVKVVAYDGYYQTCSNGKCQRKENRQFSHGKVYSVYGVATNNKNGLTYYKVASNSALYIPASWVAPPANYAVILPPVDKPKDVSSCADTTSSQTPEDKTLNACEGDVSFSGENYESCTVDTYSYYTKKCYENNYKASLKIGDVTANSKNFSLVNGGGFEAEANLSTHFSCTYTFDLENFKKDYEVVLKNLSYYKENTADWYTNYNIKKKLDTILENYRNLTEEVNNWESGYAFTKIKATLKVDSSSLSLVYDENDLVHDTIDLNGDNKKEGNYCLVNSKNTLELNGKKYNVNTNVKCGESWRLKLTLPETCLNMKTGEPEACVSGSLNQISGGKKYYLAMDKKSGNIQLFLENLGYDGNWKVTLTDCSFSIPSLLKEKVIFRQIQLTDPFLKTYLPTRVVGKNYLNTAYNFVNIIKSDTWDQNFKYRYSMSKLNIQNIRKDTKEEGVSSYLGRNCSINAKNEYICEFTRNGRDSTNNTTSDWFTKFEMKE